MGTKSKSEEPYVDPFLYEIGFFKDRSERDRLVEKVRQLNKRLSQAKSGTIPVDRQ